MRVYLICPIRKATREDKDRQWEYVCALEQAGYEVYWPATDTVKETEDNSTDVMSQNRQALALADEVHLMYDPDSEGSKLDLGMAWAWRKPLVIAGRFPGPDRRTQLERVLAHWAEVGPG